MDAQGHILVKDRIRQMSFYAFNQRGYAAVSLDEVARELKVSKKTIYKHFVNKEELLESALVAEFENLETELREWEKRPWDNDFLWHYYLVVKHYENAISTALRAELKSALPYLHERIEHFERQTMLRYLIAGLKLHRSEKRIDYPSPSRLFAQSLAAMLQSQTQAADSLVQFNLQALMKGMSVKKKKKK